MDAHHSATIITASHRLFLREALLVVGAAALLCLPMILNGFPFFQPIDTVNYIQYFDGFSSRTVQRQYSYALFLKAAAALGGLTTVGIIQSLLTAFLLYRVWRHVAKERSGLWFLLITLGTVLFSTAGFFVTRLHADAMLVPMMLSGYLLLSHKRFSLLYAALFVFTSSTHFSYWILTAVFCILYPILSFRKRIRFCPGTCATLLLAFLLPFLHLLARNEAVGGSNQHLKQYTARIVLSKLAAFQVLPQYLDAVCPTQQLELCESKEALKDGSFIDIIWGRNLWEPMVSKQEFVAVTLGSILHNPVLLAEQLFAAITQQIGKTASVDRLVEPKPKHLAAIIEAYPADSNRIENSLQVQRAGLVDSKLIQGMAKLQTILLLSFLALFIYASLGNHNSQANSLYLHFLGYFLVNAVVIALLSEPLGRYQNRIAWLGVFIGMILLQELLFTKKPPRI